MIGRVPAAAPAVQLLARPAAGRAYGLETIVRLGDVDRDGRLRLDATARVLQDVATDDVADARLDRRWGWLVRRTMIVTSRAARLGERLEATTWCSGVGRAWAERRTSLVGDRGASIEAVSLWVQIEVASGVPARVSEDFASTYEEAAAGRTVSPRLSLPAPPAGATASDRWHVRAVDVDPMGHVNNAASWAVVEELVDLGGDGGRSGRAEIEYLRPVERTGAPIDVVTAPAGDVPGGAPGATDLWLLRDDVVLVAARWTPDA